MLIYEAVFKSYYREGVSVKSILESHGNEFPKNEIDLDELRMIKIKKMRHLKFWWILKKLLDFIKMIDILKVMQFINYSDFINKLKKNFKLEKLK